MSCPDCQNTPGEQYLTGRDGRNYIKECPTCHGTGQAPTAPLTERQQNEIAADRNRFLASQGDKTVPKPELDERRQVTEVQGADGLNRGFQCAECPFTSSTRELFLSHQYQTHPNPPNDTQPPTEAVTADGLGEILEQFPVLRGRIRDEFRAELRAAIEVYFDAKFERALGEDTWEDYMPGKERIARDEARAEARTRWYSDRQKGETHG